MYDCLVPHDPVELGRLVVDRCLSAGFALAGVCDAAPSDWEEAYREWIAAGKQGEMGYLARNVEKRLDPRELVPGARSVIVVADQYGSRNQEPAPVKTGDGRVARYAQGADYHVVMKERLHAICDALRLEHPGHEFRAFVDTAPVLEREHALRAGLGWIGKNTLLIHPQLGSWLFLGGILTTLEVRLPPEQEGKGPEPDHCGTCTRCIDACPTAAISPGPERSIDARRCISYLTIEHRSAIAPELAAQMGEWLYGCDVCQEVCPHNSPRSAEVDVAFPFQRFALDPRAGRLLIASTYSRLRGSHVVSSPRLVARGRRRARDAGPARRGANAGSRRRSPAGAHHRAIAERLSGKRDECGRR